jgi:multidrug transporter EmrE-like cation transporter
VRDGCDTNGTRVSKNVNDSLSYGKKLDWGNKPLSPRYTKIYGLAVFILSCMYLWKLHHRNTSAVWQLALTLLVCGFGLALILQFWKKTERSTAFFVWYQLGFILLMVISLLSA